MNYYDVNFITENEILICCILIIREEYPDYYKEIVNSPKLFNEEYSGEKEAEKRFMRIAQTALGKVEISNLSKVLTNSYHQFDNIPADVQDAIDTFDAEKVLSIWNTEKNNIVDYIFDRFDYARKNSFIDNELVPLFDMLVLINIKYPFETHFSKKTDEKILDFLPNIISKTNNYVALCNYALLREKQKDKKIKIVLIEESKRTEKQEKEKHWQSLYNAVLKVFQDKGTSIALSSTYTLYQQGIDYENFSTDQIEYLISNEFVQQRIAELPTDEDSKEILLNTETKEYEVVKWLFENKKNIDEGTYGHFFAHIIGKDSSENRMRGKAIDEIAEILKFANLFLKLIPDRKLTTQPQTLYSLIVDDRQVPKSQYANNDNVLTNQQYYNSQYYTSANFFDECIIGEKYISELSEFVINTYRVSNNNTSVVTEIGKLLKKINLNAEFLQLIGKGYELTSLLDLIFDNAENEECKFEEADRLELLKFCFNQTTQLNKYIISEDKARVKLDELLIYAQKENSNVVFTLLETLSEQERYKEFLADLIAEKDSTFVNTLPQKLLKLAVNSFVKETYNDFVDNFEFLSVILQNGTNTQKGYVISILTAKLDNNSDIDKVLSLIETMKNIPSFDSNGILNSHLGKYQEDNKDKLSKEINKKIEQLKKSCKN